MLRLPCSRCQDVLEHMPWRCCMLNLSCRCLTLCLLQQQKTWPRPALPHVARAVSLLLPLSGPPGLDPVPQLTAMHVEVATLVHRDNPPDDPERDPRAAQGEWSTRQRRPSSRTWASTLDQQQLRGCCCLKPFMLPLQETPDQRVAAVVDEVEEAQQQALTPELVRRPELPEGVPTLNVALIFGGAVTSAGLSALSQTRMWLQSMEGLSRQLVGSCLAACLPVSLTAACSVMLCQKAVHLAVQCLQAYLAPAWLGSSVAEPSAADGPAALLHVVSLHRHHWCMLAVQPARGCAGHWLMHHLQPLEPPIWAACRHTQGQMARSLCVCLCVSLTV